MNTTNWQVFKPTQREASGAVPWTHPRAGAGTQLTVSAMGFSFSAAPSGQQFNHPWRPSLGGGRLTFRLGVVQALAGTAVLEPTIQFNGNDVPMSGVKGTTPTPLILTPGVAKLTNGGGVSYACLDVFPDLATGALNKDSKAKIVHDVTPISHAANRGRCALALIVWSGNAPLRVYPLVHFNLRYLRILAKAGDPTGAPKHLFL